MEGKPKKGVLHRIGGALWDCLDYPPEQRRIVLKLDLTIVLWGSLSSFIKYLDKSNLSNAYNSGMKEYLGIKGNELNYANTAYNIASIIFGLPCAYLMNRYNTRWFILTIEVLWSIVTFCFVSIKTPLQMIVLRTILGIVECGHFSAFVFLIGTYYNKREAARRQVILQAFTVLGPMFATYIQAGASSSLDGTDGLEGWQWTFLIDGIVSVFVIICQVIFVPDILDRIKPNRFFSKADIQWLRTRRPPIKHEAKPETRWGVIKEQLSWLKQWRVWAFWGFGVCQDIISLSNQSTQFWLKGWNKIKPGSYTIAQFNTLTSPMYAISFMCSVLLGWTSDTWLRGRRWPGIIAAGVWSFAIMLALAIIPVYGSKPVRFFLYYNTDVGQAASGLYWCYSQELFSHNLREAAFVAGGINVCAYIANSIVNNIWFKTANQPYVQTGHYISAVFGLFYVAIALALGLTEKKYVAKFQISSEKESDEESISAEESTTSQEEGSSKKKDYGVVEISRSHQTEQK